MTTLTRRLRGVALLALAAPLIATAVAVPANADANAVPNYEVKLDLLSGTLDSTGAPIAAVRSAFGISGDPKALSYEYYDTDALGLDGQGWDVRLRHQDGKDLDLDYKKRFPVIGGDIDAALTTANQQGFDSSDTNYDAQVDWTYSKQTLSFSDKKSESADDYSGTSLPSASDGLDMLVDDIPGKLEDWNQKNWGKDTLQSARQHGPVTSQEWDGSWQGEDVSIEVLPVVGASGSGTEDVIELSFKTDTLDEATDLRNQAMSLTDGNGWLYHGDILKTDLILTRY